MNSVTRREVIDDAAKFVCGKAAGFQEEGEILEAVRVLRAIREVAADAGNRSELAKATDLQKEATSRFHERLALSPTTIPVIDLCERHKLTVLSVSFSWS